jgi:cold-inducible RNA-binding protein
MGRKLYVGNLSFRMDDAALGELFAQAGKVESATIVRDMDTGRARGFAFVEMATDAEAQQAIQMFNSKEIEGRSIVVNEARPRPERGGGGGPRGGGGGHRGGGGGGGRNDSRGGYGKRW